MKKPAPKPKPIVVPRIGAVRPVQQVGGSLAGAPRLTQPARDVISGPRSQTTKPVKPAPKPPPYAYQPTPGGFTPYTPPAMPPPGSYDPAIDQGLGQADRSLGRLGASIGAGGTNRIRADVDYTQDIGEFNRRLNEGLADIAQDRGRLGEDYQRNLAVLQRNYARLGNSQTQRARSQGVAQGGALIQAMEKRAANQAWEQAPIDQSYQRGTDDLTERETEFRADIDRGIGARGKSHIRQAQDWDQQWWDANVENIAYKADAGRSAWYSAIREGRAPGSEGPGNELTAPDGTVYRVEQHGNAFMYRLPDGRLVRSLPGVSATGWKPQTHIPSRAGRTTVTRNPKKPPKR